MYVGFLTACFGKKPLDDIVRWAGKNGFNGLEVAIGPGSSQCDAAKLLSERGVAALRQVLVDAGVGATSFAYYDNGYLRDKRVQAWQDYFYKVIEVASELGTDIICTMAGAPPDGMNRLAVARDLLPDAFGPVLERAAQANIKLALENWPGSLLQGLDTFDAVFGAVPHRNFGLNFDPSHLVWQGVDYLAGVRRYPNRIFHVHAKDTEIRSEVRSLVGALGPGWWRYVIPGYGVVSWGEFVSALRGIGYDGILSIEHEDSAFGVEAGLLAGKRCLDPYV